MIHSEDNTKVETKITDEGEIFIYCPKCGRVWETPAKVMKEPEEKREFKYGGAELDLALVKTGKSKGKGKSDTAASAKRVFPEAFK